MVPSPRIELKICPYHKHIIPLNYEGILKQFNLIVDNKAFFSNYCLNFFINLHYIHVRIFYGHSL
jgi:hypothetical protein